MCLYRKMTLRVLIKGNNPILYIQIQLEDYFNFLWPPKDALNNISAGLHLSGDSKAKIVSYCVFHGNSEEMGIQKKCLKKHESMHLKRHHIALHEHHIINK